VKTRLLSFIAVLRTAGLSTTVSETLDAMRAVAIVGIDRSALREGLAAALVKDEADRSTFDAVFDRFFAAPGRQRTKSERPQRGADGQGHGEGQDIGVARAPQQSERQRQEPSRQERALRRERGREPHRHAAERLGRQRALQTIPFSEMTPPQVEECAALVAMLAQRFLAHLRRRQRGAPSGRLDLRRTLRRSITTGGVPIDPAFRRRRPGRPDLIALCDYSHSVATATDFLLALLAPAHVFFRRVHLFAYVDQPVEISVESGTLVPHDRLDLYARSDFGNVLVTFWQRSEPLLTRNTVVLILGDARNNRRPPRADVLARMHNAVRRIVWLNPESPQRWNTGDSVMRAYQRHCDTVLAASTVRELYIALRRTFRSS
jgi:uncharacterized protein